MSPPKARPRLLFFMPGLPVGGAERHTLDLRRRLIERGYEADLLVHGRRRSEAMVKAPGAEGAVMLDVRGMSDLGGWGATRKAIQASRPDIIFGINQTPAIVSAVLRATGATRARVACIFHTTLMRPNERLRLPLFKAAAPHFDAMVYVSENQRSYWLRNGLKSRRDVAIRNGVDLARFQPVGAERRTAKAAAGFAEGDFVIGVLAALRPEKNHVMLVEAIAKLRARGVPAVALFVGEGPMRPAIESRAAELGVADHVKLAGEQSDVRPYIAAFDVGVLCSSAVETFSLAALELLATGVPMFMSDIGGASEVIEEGGNGALFAPGDLDALVSHLEAASAPAALARLQTAARPSVERFHIDNMMQGYVDLIEALAS